MARPAFMYFLYNLALWIASPLWLVWAAERALRGRLPGFAQRCGWLPALPPGSGAPVWIHAVSLGEVKVATTLARELRRREAGLRAVITTSTRTGFEEARRACAPEDVVLFPPFDLPSICRRFLKQIQPRLLVITETELWPNLFREAHRAGTPVIIVNGRISDRAYPRYLRTRLLWRRVLPQAAAIYAQSAGDRERFIAMGAPAALVRDSGNLKQLVQPPTSQVVARWQARLRENNSMAVVAGSTMPGEEELVLEAFQALRQSVPRLVLILAPRHPERFDEVARAIASRNLPLQRRSQLVGEDALIAEGVLLLDSIGELAAVYELADVAFVGGTLVPTGGHNILEPISFSRPTVIGPSMHNFAAMADLFLAPSAASAWLAADGVRCGAVLQVEGPAGLARVLKMLLRYPERAAEIGRAANLRLRQHLWGLDAMIDEIAARMGCTGGDESPARGTAVPVAVPAQPSRER